MALNSWNFTQFRQIKVKLIIPQCVLNGAAKWQKSCILQHLKKLLTNFSGLQRVDAVGKRHRNFTRKCCSQVSMVISDIRASNNDYFENQKGFIGGYFLVKLFFPVQLAQKFGGLKFPLKELEL